MCMKSVKYKKTKDFIRPSPRLFRCTHSYNNISHVNMYIACGYVSCTPAERNDIKSYRSEIPSVVYTHIRERNFPNVRFRISRPSPNTTGCFVPTVTLYPFLFSYAVHREGHVSPQYRNIIVYYLIPRKTTYRKFRHLCV